MQRIAPALLLHVDRLHWSKDGKTVALGARRDRELWSIVLPVEFRRRLLARRVCAVPGGLSG